MKVIVFGALLTLSLTTWSVVANATPPTSSDPTQHDNTVEMIKLPEMSFPNNVVITRISENVIVLNLADVPTPNLITAIASEKGLVVVDTLSPHRLALKYKEIIAEKFKRRDFTYVINTHSHPDHTGGNQVFEETEIISHENCLEALEQRAENLPSFLSGGEAWTRNRIEELSSELESETKDSKKARQIRASIGQFERVIDSYTNGFILTLPTITFLDQMSLDLGDLTVKMFYFGKLHTRDNIVVLVPEEEILVVGDLFNKYYLNVGAGVTGQLDIQRWLDILDIVLDPENRVKHVICGHTSILTRQELLDRRDYIKKLWNGVVAAKTEGLSLREAQKRLSLNREFPYLKGWGLVLDEAALEQRHAETIQAYWNQFHTSADTPSK